MSRATRFAQSSLEEVRRALARHVDLREGGLVEDGDCLAACQVLHADRGRPELPSPAARTKRLVAALRVRLEPVRALPAGLLPEHGTELLQARIRGREPQRPPRAPLVARELDVVVRLVDLPRPGERVLAAPVRGAEPPRVHVPDVERGRTLDDPLGHELSHPACARQPVRAEAGRDPEPAHVRRPEDELAVRREGLRAVDEPDHLHLGKRGHADDGVLEELLEARPVLVEQARVEVGRDPFETPRRAVALVAAHDEPARLRTEVDEQRRVAHRRHVGR